jgi:hypothetical protein
VGNPNHKLNCWTNGKKDSSSNPNVTALNVLCPNLCDLKIGLGVTTKI